jgi:hypothetical protein
MAADKLAAELAFKANVDAVSRDYVCEPHLGGCSMARRDRSPPASCTQVWQCPNAMQRILQSTGLSLVLVDPLWWQKA